VGGGDQWFNIISGADLIRRVEGGAAYGLTTPLLTTASGAKMGKTVAGAVWLDPEKVSPFDYNQYWYNCDDRDVERFLKLFTFLPLERIEDAMKGDIRAAKRLLADEATAIVHGRDTSIPEHAAALPAPVIDLLVASGLAKSKGEARRLIDNGGIAVGADKVTSYDAVMTAPGVLKAGKKRAVSIVTAGGAGSAG
jgi:tyrosyl-tRNA synthetase